MADQEKELLCAYCHARLFEEDDVVWCPECGAPHHRACWESLGHCARQDRHGLPEPEEPEIVDEPEPEPGQEEGSPFFPPGFTEGAFDPYAGVDPEGEMNGLPVVEVATFVRVNTRRYIPRFRVMCDTGRRFSWNPGAFLFGSVWLFYRKCYLEGFAALVLTLIANMATLPFMSAYYRAVEGLLGMSGGAEPSALAQQEMLDKLLSDNGWLFLLALAGVAVWIALHVLIGFFGDRVYLRRCLDKVAAIRDDEEVDDKLRALVMAGGVQPLLAAAAFVVIQVLPGYLITFF